MEQSIVFNIKTLGDYKEAYEMSQELLGLIENSKQDTPHVFNTLRSLNLAMIMFTVSSLEKENPF